MGRKFNADTIGYLNLFSSLTNINAKDCFFKDSKLVFVVKEGDIGKAVGREGSNINKIKKIFKKDIKVIEFSEDITKFVRNLIYPIQAQNIYKEDETVYIEAENNITKGKIYGRNRENLKNIKEIVDKYFKIRDIKIK